MNWCIFITVSGEKLQNNQTLWNLSRFWGCEEAALSLTRHSFSVYVEKSSDFADAGDSKFYADRYRCIRSDSLLREESTKAVIAIVCIQRDACLTKFVRHF